MTQPPPSIAHTIRTKKQQYCRYADTHQWERMSRILAPNLRSVFVDANGDVINEGGAVFSFSSREEFVAFFKAAFETQQTMHVLSGSGEMEMEMQMQMQVGGSSGDGDSDKDKHGDKNGQQEGKGEVKTVWGVVYQAASKDVSGGWSGTGGGHYYETWRVVDGEWMIVELRFQRIYWKVW